MKWEIAFDVRNELGEGPVYDDLRDELIWFDILGHTLFIGSLATQKIGQNIAEYHFDEPVSAAFLGRDDALFIAGASGLYQLDRASGNTILRRPIEADNPATRANDSRTSPGGAIWFGTMGRKLETGAGAIYHLRPGKNSIDTQILFPNMSIPNATCFSADGRVAYFCDTPKQQILSLSIDPETGLPIGSPSLFADLAPENLNPDGAVIDAEGCLWNAQWGAGRVACYGPDGKFRRAIKLPASQITCPCFGGTNLTTLFVTSAYEKLDRRKEPLAGAVFAIEMEVAGLPERRINLQGKSI